MEIVRQAPIRSWRDQMISMASGWGWVLAAGVAMTCLGAMAFSAPLASTIGLVFAIGALLLASGLVNLVYAFRLRQLPGSPGRFLQSFVSILTGLLMLRFPGPGAGGLGLALAFYFFLSGATKWWLASELRPHRGWGWIVASSFCSFAVGILILATFPKSALITPGLLLGIELIFSGVSLAVFSFELRKAGKLLKTGGEERVLKRAA